MNKLARWMRVNKSKRERMTTQNKHYTKKKESRIPKFANREEEAAFWDTQDVSDYWDELRPVKLKVAKNLSTLLI